MTETQVGDGRSPDLVADIADVPLFEGLTHDQRTELVAAAEEVVLEPGTVYFAEGEPASYWWVLLDGALDLIRHVGREDVVVGRMDVAGRWAGGMQAWDPNGTYLATGRGAVEGRVLKVPSAVLREKITAWFPLGMHLISGLYGTARSIESNARQRDSLVTLGTLAAGLAHELNNPAAAATRGVRAMEETAGALVDALLGLAQAQLSPDEFLTLDSLRRDLIALPAPSGGLDLADREEELGERLDDADVDDAWTIAPALAASGADVAWIERLLDEIPAAAVTPGLRWIAGTMSMLTMLTEVADATQRISELVSSVRSYTQMDRASAQRLDVTEGLDSTLVMLAHKARGIEVVKEYAAELPEIEGLPGELNQVWTNLLDNALDAVREVEGGRVRIRVFADDSAAEHESVVVEVRDNGSGMPPEVAARAFDAFFTTKEVGSGTGLGLDIARRIVVERHSGAIDIDRDTAVEPPETVLRVRLPR